jgi:hypothetical protein
MQHAKTNWKDVMKMNDRRRVIRRLLTVPLLVGALLTPAVPAKAAPGSLTLECFSTASYIFLNARVILAATNGSYLRADLQRYENGGFVTKATWTDKIWPFTLPQTWPDYIVRHRYDGDWQLNVLAVDVTDGRSSRKYNDCETPL